MNGHGDDGETAAAERDISRAERFRDKSRLVLRSVETARLQFDAGMDEEADPMDASEPSPSDATEVS